MELALNKAITVKIWFLPLFNPSFRLFVIPQADDYAWESDSVAQKRRILETSRDVRVEITMAKLTTRLPVYKGWL